MARLIGAGGNGVVYAELGPDGRECAVKYWIPHRLEGKLVGGDAATGAFVRAFADYPNYTASIKGGVIQLESYGPAFPYAEIIRVMQIHRVRLTTGWQVTQELSPPACALYVIEGAVRPTEIANGVLAMELAGPSLPCVMPVPAWDALGLVSVLCTAARSALLQGVAMADLKPWNVCRSGLGWVVVDVDNLPAAGATADGQATLRVAGATRCGPAMIAALVVTAAYALGSIGLDGVLRYHYDRCPAQTREQLAAVCPPVLLELFDAPPLALAGQLQRTADHCRVAARLHAGAEDAGRTTPC
jgi:hypothetical protein